MKNLVCGARNDRGSWRLNEALLLGRARFFRWSGVLKTAAKSLPAIGSRLQGRY